MLPFPERREHLPRVQMMASRNDGNIDGWVVNQPILVGGTISEAEFLRRMLGVRSGGCTNRNEHSIG